MENISGEEKGECHYVYVSRPVFALIDVVFRGDPDVLEEEKSSRFGGRTLCLDIPVSVSIVDRSV